MFYIPPHVESTITSINTLPPTATYHHLIGRRIDLSPDLFLVCLTDAGAGDPCENIKKWVQVITASTVWLLINPIIYMLQLLHKWNKPSNLASGR